MDTLLGDVVVTVPRKHLNSGEPRIDALTEQVPVSTHITIRWQNHNG